MGWIWTHNLPRFRGFPVIEEGEVLPPWSSQFEEGMVGCHAQVDKKPITGRYFVNSLEGIEEEQADEEMTTMKTGPVDVTDEVTMYDVEILEGEGSTVVSPAAVEKM